MLMIIEQGNYNSVSLWEIYSHYKHLPAPPLYLIFWVEKYQMEVSVQTLCYVILPGKLQANKNA